jgi:DNA-binding protein HU-beta
MEPPLLLRLIEEFVKMTLHIGLDGVRHTPAKVVTTATWRAAAFRKRFDFSRSLGERAVPVNKNDLVSMVADRSDLSKADATKAVDAVFDCITTTMQRGEEVRIVGFGTFSVANRAASTGRNPQTGESIFIPASRQPKFKAGKGLKDAVK